MSHKRDKVLILTSTGFIIRNLLLGRFARELAKHYDLVVASINHQDEELQSHLQDLPITWIPFKELPEMPHDRFWDRYTLFQHWIYRIKQAAIDTNGVEIQTRLFEKSQPLRHRMIVRGMVMIGRILKKFGLVPALEDRYLKKISNMEICDHWREVIQTHQPKALISTMLTHTTTYSFSYDLPAVLAAKEANIPVGTLVQSWDNLSTKASVIPNFLSRYWTWSHFMTQQLVQYHPRVPESSCVVTGSPQYDFHLSPDLQVSREEYLKELGLDPNHPYIVVGSTPKKFMPYEHLMFDSLIDKVHKRFPDLQILIRFHPKDDMSRWIEREEEYKSKNVVWQETSPRIHMDLGGFQMPKDFYREQVNTLRHAAIVLNTSSTLTIDASILDVPTICFAYDVCTDDMFPEGRALAYSNSNHYGPLIKTGGVLVAYSEEEMIEYIGRYLNKPEENREERKKIVECVTREVDGQAGIRMAQDTVEMINESNNVENHH